MASAYLEGFEPNVHFQVIATVGDTVGTKSDGVTPYRMVGIPDGLGAFDNGDGTITVVMNHELGATNGIVREHGAAGAFVSQWTLNKSDLSIVGVEDAIKQVFLWDDALAAANTDTNDDGVIDAFVASTYAIGRLCSADLADVSAYQWTDPDTGITYGTDARIFMTGEEVGAEGKEFGLVLTGGEAGNAYELAYTGLFSWENAISSNYAQLKTINIGMDDSTPGQVYVYIGEKKTVGTEVDKAGLNDGKLYGIRALNLGANSNNESDAAAASGTFELVDLGDVSGISGAQLQANSEAAGVTEFLRPEDGQFDPTNPNVFYFVTTAGITNQSRLYKLTFTDIENPEAGGTIEAVLSSSDLPTNGSVGPRMMDNITVNAEGKVIIQEDVGNNAHIGRVLEYDPVTDTVTVLAQHEPDFYTGSAATNPTFKTLDEESSGVIEVTDLLGYTAGKAYLLDVQSHNTLADAELVQDGQFLAMYVDDVVTQGSKFDNTLNGSAADEDFNGKGGNDSINAGSGNDTLKGAAGNDQLNGGAGDDSLEGGAGDDVLIGGKGIDMLRGGAGGDTFVFAKGDSSVQQLDQIKDFKAIDGDAIDLTGLGITASDVIISQVSKHSWLVSVDLDDDGGVDFAIGVSSNSALQLADVLV